MSEFTSASNNDVPASSAMKIPQQDDSDSSEDREVPEHVRQVHARLERCLRHLGLTPFSTKFIVQHVSSILQKADSAGEESPLPHVLPYLLQLIQPRPRIDDPLIDRKGCPQLIPGLRSQPFWEASQFPWAVELENHFHEIREEFLQLHDNLAGFQRYRSSDDSATTDRGHWHVCYLSLHGMDFSENAYRCPQTMKIISSIPRFYHHALFSALDKNTHVTAHYGPTNKKLRCFLPLFVPLGDECCTITVNHITRPVQEGQVLIFDDSFFHEAQNNSMEAPRIVLILDIWHPDLTDAEVKILEFLNKAQIAAAKRLAKALAEESASSSVVADESASGCNDNSSFLTTIEANKQVGISEEDAVRIWGEYIQSKRLT